VGGVAFASALFQARLETELRERLRTPNAEEVRILILSRLTLPIFHYLVDSENSPIERFHSHSPAGGAACGTRFVCGGAQDRVCNGRMRDTAGVYRAPAGTCRCMFTRHFADFFFF
jgi:hypothetical protein